MNRFKHAKWWRSYLDKLKQGFWKFTGLNFKWKNERSIALCQSRSKYARKEQWRRGKQSEENRGQQLQSSFALLEHFEKSIFYMLYTISKLRKSRIQRFKPCTIWSWNEEDMAFGRQLLQACAKFAQHLEIRTTPPGRTTIPNSHNPCVVRILLYFCRLHFRSFLMYFFDVISFLILVTNQSQALLL